MKRYKLKDLSIGKLEYGSGAAACEYDGSTRYVRITDIDSNGKLGNDIVSPNYVDEKYILNEGDVLFARTGATVGKTYRYHGNDGRCLYAGFLIRVIPNQKIIRPDYLYYFTKSPQYNSFVQSSMKVVAQPNINAKQYGELEFNVPELAVQDEIIEKLSKVVRVIDARKLELLKLDNLIKARFVELFGNPVANDKGWDTTSCKNLMSKIGSGATPKGGRESYCDEGISLIRSMNVYNNRFEYKDLAHITDEQAEQLDNVTIEKKDVLLNITGASVARCCIVPDDLLPARVNQHVSILRCKERILPDFVCSMFTEDNYQRLLWNIATAGGATREAITKQQIEELMLIVPPIDLQKQFMNFVHQVDKSKFGSKNHIKNNIFTY